MHCMPESNQAFTRKNDESRRRDTLRVFFRVGLLYSEPPGQAELFSI
jgi:hypothetical protein